MNCEDNSIFFPIYFSYYLDAFPPYMNINNDPICVMHDLPLLSTPRTGMTGSPVQPSASVVLSFKN